MCGPVSPSVHLCVFISRCDIKEANLLIIMQMTHENVTTPNMLLNSETKSPQRGAKYVMIRRNIDETTRYIWKSKGKVSK